MVTALTYQFQGWLASLMSNPRRRRTVIVATTAVFVLIVQLPNLLNVYSCPREHKQRAARSASIGGRSWRSWIAHFKSQEIDATEYDASGAGSLAEARSLPTQQADRETVEHWEQTARLVNLVLPVGWLPLGVMSAAEGRVMPSILGLLGMTLIGTASLWRAYRTTIGLYQGQSTNRKGRPATAAACAGERPEAGRPAARSATSRLVGAGFGHRAGGLALAHAGARGEDDVVDPGDHEPHLRLHALAGGVTHFRSRAGRWSRSEGWSSCSWACSN